MDNQEKNTHTSRRVRILASGITLGTLLSGCNLLDDDDKSNTDPQPASVISFSEPISSESNCAEGGIRFLAGTDSNRNGILESSETSETLSICSSAITEEVINDLISVTQIGYGDVRCSTGGFSVSTQSNDSEEIVCNPATSNDDSIDLIGSLSASPANPEVNSEVTLSVTLARIAEEGEVFSYQWEQVGSAEPIENNTASLSITTPETPATLIYQVTVTSSLNQEEKSQISLTVSDALQAATTNAISTSSKQIFIPNNYEQSNEQPQGDFDGAVFFASQNSLQAQSISASSDTQTSTREVAAFVAQRPTFNSGSDSRSVLDNFANQINLDNRFNNINVSTSQLFSGSISLGSYQLTLNTSMAPTELGNELIQILAFNKLGGSITGLPSVTENENSYSSYRLFMTILYLDKSTSDQSDDELLLISSLVAETQFESFSSTISGLVDGTNIASPSDTLSTQQESFVASSDQDKADFLFVIDNSGSMFDEQQAVADAADAFIARIENTGLDYQIGTINTSSVIELADTNANGKFTSDLTEFKNDVINQGTNGSSTETGIYNSEQALQSQALGDTQDGIVTLEGYPRENSSLSVVFLSDEPSQYTRRSDGTFDVTNNLFLDRNYRVYSIVLPDTQLWTDSQYDDLALVSGGSVANISDVSTFETIMDDIAVKAGAASSSFKLINTPISGSIIVKNNGILVPQSRSNGWNYISQSNSVVFYGNSIPQESDSIEITYDTIVSNAVITPSLVN